MCRIKKMMIEVGKKNRQQNISAVFLIFWQYKKMRFGSISGAVNNSISGGIFNYLAVRIIQMAVE